MNENKSIAIVELASHAETLNSLCIVLGHTRFRVTVFTLDSIHRELDGRAYQEKFNWQIKPPEEGTAAFIRRHLEGIMAHDLLFINTVLYDFKAYLPLLEHPCSIYRIHNAHFHFAFAKHLSPLRFLPFYNRDWQFIWKNTLLRGDLFYKRIFIKKIKYYSFPNPMIEKYVLGWKPALRGRTVAIPIGCYDETHARDVEGKKGGDFVICIPGTVDDRRKDLGIIPRVMRGMLPTSKRAVKLVFLGRVEQSGRAVMEELETLAASNDRLSIVSFTERIPQSIFDHWMNECDIILSPILQRTRFFYNWEKYGYTKISGSVTDIYRYGKKAIIPDFYPIDDNLRNSVISYKDSAELTKILLQLLNAPPSNEREIPANFLPQTLAAELEVELSSIF